MQRDICRWLFKQIFFLVWCFQHLKQSTISSHYVQEPADISAATTRRVNSCACWSDGYFFFASGASRNFLGPCLFCFPSADCLLCTPLILCFPLSVWHEGAGPGPPWLTQNKYVFNQLLISGITGNDRPAAEQSRKKEQNTKYEGSREGSRLLEACSASQ